MWQEIACALAVAERVLKLILVGDAVADMLTQPGGAAGWKHAVRGMVWMAVRYICASHRHICAGRAGDEARAAAAAEQQRRWLEGADASDDTRVAEMYALLQRAGDALAEERARRAIDLVPGLVSVAAGLWRLLGLVRAPRGAVCAACLVLGDVAHERLSRRQVVSEGALAEMHASAMARMYATAEQSRRCLELVRACGRQGHEMERMMVRLREASRAHRAWTVCCNYQGSLRHWVAHIHRGVLLWLASGHLDHDAQLVAVLFYANEVQRGLDECRHYQRRRRELDASLRALRAAAPPPPGRAAGGEVRAAGCGLRLDRVSLRLGGRAVLRDLSLALEHGEQVVVLGDNGAGKTTLFRLLQRLHSPSAGRAALPAAHRVLSCEQRPQLFENATVPYNVAYGCSGLRPGLASERSWGGFPAAVREAARQLGIEGLAGAPVAALSGGERQRVSVARALARALERPREARLLLLDEFDSALDREGRERAAAAARRIRGLSGCAVLRITHTALRPGCAAGCAALVLEGGRIARRGAYRDLWDERQRRASGGGAKAE